MKKIIYVFTCVLLLSCNNSKVKKESEEKTKLFFNAIKSDKTDEVIALYPSFENFESYYKSDSINIKSCSIKDDLITVSLTNNFTNGFGKLTQSDISLFFKKDSLDNIKIFDSKGLTDFSKNDTYLFSVNYGCINKEVDTSDQQILKILKKTKPIMTDEAVNVYLELMKEVKVVDWNWETGYRNSASGDAIVKNYSSFSIPNLKYKITYKNRYGNEITSDDGYVSYDPIEAGESKSFSFYTGYVGNASKASIELIFDEDLIFKYIIEKEWNGNECNEYQNNNSKKN